MKKMLLTATLAAVTTALVIGFSAHAGDVVPLHSAAEVPPPGAVAPIDVAGDGDQGSQSASTGDDASAPVPTGPTDEEQAMFADFSKDCAAHGGQLSGSDPTQTAHCHAGPHWTNDRTGEVHTLPATTSSEQPMPPVAQNATGEAAFRKDCELHHGQITQLPNGSLHCHAG